MRLVKLSLFLTFCLSLLTGYSSDNILDKNKVTNPAVTRIIYKGLELRARGKLKDAKNLFDKTRKNRLVFLTKNASKQQLNNTINTFQLGMLYFGTFCIIAPDKKSEKIAKGAMWYLEKCLKTKDFNQQLTDRDKAYIYYAIGKINLDLVMWPTPLLKPDAQDKALAESLLYSKKALQYFNKIKLKNRYLAMTLFNLATVYGMQKNDSLALLHIKKLEDTSKELEFSNKSRVLLFANVFKIQSLYYTDRKKEAFALLQKVFPLIKNQFPDQKIAIERLTQWQKEYESTYSSD